MADLISKLGMIYELKRKNRWIVRFPAALGLQEFYLKSAARPSLTQKETEVEFLNTSVFILGRFTWNTMVVTLRDPIGPSATQAVMEWVRLGSESITGRQGYSSGVKQSIYVEMLDPTGVVVESWLLQDTLLTDVDFGDLDMGDDGVAEIKLTLRPDRCINLF